MRPNEPSTEFDAQLSAIYEQYKALSPDFYREGETSPFTSPDMHDLPGQFTAICKRMEKAMEYLSPYAHEEQPVDIRDKNWENRTVEKLIHKNQAAGDYKGVRRTLVRDMAELFSKASQVESAYEDQRMGAVNNQLCA